MGILSGMTAKDNDKRISCLEALSQSYELLEDFHDPEFPLYGQNIVLPCVKQLLDTYQISIKSEAQVEAKRECIHPTIAEPGKVPMLEFESMHTSQVVEGPISNSGQSSPRKSSQA